MRGMVGCRSTGNGRKTPLEPVGRVGKLELAGLDTRLKHARLTATRGRRISKTPAASTAGPFLSSLAFSVTSLWKSMEKGRNWKRKSNKNLPRKLEKSILKVKKSRLGGGLGALGGDLETKVAQGKMDRLSWQILVNFGRARIDQNLAQMGQDGANLEPRWRQEPPSWGQDGHLEAIWGAFWSIFGGLGSDL